MHKPNVSKMLKDLKYTTVKHSPAILTGIGVAGMITTTIMAVRATPKALAIIEAEKKYREERQEDFTNVNMVKVAWKAYIPAAITGTVSMACIIGASSVNARRNAALTTAYTLSETALTDYRKKVIETIGEKKEQTVRDAVAKEKIEQNPVKNNEVLITGKGQTLCFDVVSGRYFKSDIDKLRKVENELNRRMRDEMYVSLNDFYYEIGLPNIRLGDDLGWNIDAGYVELRFSSQLTEEEEPCLVIEYGYGPRYDFRNLH